MRLREFLSHLQGGLAALAYATLIYWFYYIIIIIIITRTEA